MSNLRQSVAAGVVRIVATAMPVDPWMPFRTPVAAPGVGTGFLYPLEPMDKCGTLRFIVTCYHVVEHCHDGDVHVQLPPDNERFPAHVVSVCPDLDVALLVVDNIQDRVAAKYTLADLPDLGQTVYAAGYPLAKALTVSAGEYTAFEDGKLKHSAPIDPGNSGGPLFVANGSGNILCVGMSDSGKPGASNTAFAVPMQVIRYAMPHMLCQKTCRASPMAPERVLRLPTTGIVYHRGLQKGAGVTIRDVHPDSVFQDLVRKGDQLTHIRVDGGKTHAINHNGTVQWRWPGKLMEDVSLVEFLLLHDPWKAKVSFARTPGDAATAVAAGATQWTPARPPGPVEGFTLHRWTVYDGPQPYLAIGALFLGNLHAGHFSNERGPQSIEPFCINATGDQQFQDRVAVLYVVPGSKVHQQGTVVSGTILERVNGETVATLRDVDRALGTNGGATGGGSTGAPVTLLFRNGVHLMLDKDLLRHEEAHAARLVPSQQRPGALR